MARESGSKDAGVRGQDFVSAVDRLRRDAAPVIAKALDLDRAEAAEAALNAMTELALAARAMVRALPLPPESRRHVENAEREAVRAAKLALASIDKKAKQKGSSTKLRQVAVDFKAAPEPAKPKKRTKKAPAGARKRPAKRRKK